MSLSIWYAVKLTDITQEMIDASKQASIKTCRKNNPGILGTKKRLLAFDTKDVPISIVHLGYSPIDLETELAKSEWQPVDETN